MFDPLPGDRGEDKAEPDADPFVDQGHVSERDVMVEHKDRPMPEIERIGNLAEKNEGWEGRKAMQQSGAGVRVGRGRIRKKQESRSEAGEKRSVTGKRSVDAEGREAGEDHPESGKADRFPNRARTGDRSGLREIEGEEDSDVEFP